MSEQFKFVVFLERPALPAPSLTYQIVERLFEAYLGSPLTTMQFDLHTGHEIDPVWRTNDSAVPATILPQDLFFVRYAAAAEPSLPGASIHLRCPPNCAIVTISLADRSIEADPPEIARICASLYMTFRLFSEHCVVTAGSDIEIDAYSVAEALQNLADLSPLARWTASSIDAADFLLATGQFSTELQTPEFVLMRRSP